MHPPPARTVPTVATSPAPAPAPSCPQAPPPATPLEHVRAPPCPGGAPPHAPPTPRTPAAPGEAPRQRPPAGPPRQHQCRHRVTEPARQAAACCPDLMLGVRWEPCRHPDWLTGLSCCRLSGLKSTQTAGAPVECCHPSPIGAQSRGWRRLGMLSRCRAGNCCCRRRHVAGPPAVPGRRRPDGPCRTPYQPWRCLSARGCERRRSGRRAGGSSCGGGGAAHCEGKGGRQEDHGCQLRGFWAC